MLKYILLNFILTFAIVYGSSSYDFSNSKNYVNILSGIQQRIEYAKYKRPSEILKKTYLKGLSDEATVGIIEKLQALLSSGQDQPTLYAYPVSDLCLNHTQLFLEGLVDGEEWAMRMLDSMDKMMSGVLDGNTVWYGSYDECVNIRAQYPLQDNMTDPTAPQEFAYQTKYCQLTIPLEVPVSDAGGRYSGLFGNLRWAMCFPEGCSNADARNLANIVLEMIPIGNITLVVRGGSCKLMDKQLPDWKADTKAMIGVCSAFAFIILVATLFDYFLIQWPKQRQAEAEVDEEETCPMEVDGGIYETKYDHTVEKEPLISKTNKVWKPYEPGIVGKILLSFSLYTNGSKLFNTKQTAGTLTAINGIRFLSMNWVILGHTFSTGIQRTENLADIYPRKVNQWTFMAIINATVSVDSFFTMSGLLIGYLTLKEMKRNGGIKKINWPMFYFHRFWRLSPPYMLCIGINVGIFYLLSDGPFWPQTGTANNCKDNWWTNLLYVNNLVNEDKQCYGVGWYLANDMQFYWITPLLLIPIFYSEPIGLAWNLIVLTGSFIATYVISATYKLPPTSFGGVEVADTEGDFSKHYYTKPWCRIGPYIVGLLMGYVLYKTDCKVKMSKFVNLCGWFLATCCACFVLYCLADTLNGNSLMSVELAAIYNAVHRSVWGAALCWVIFACCTGHGGFVNTLMSWNGMVPLSRLTYCVYLVHGMVQQLYTNSLRKPFYWNDLTVSFLFLGYLVFSYAAAFVISMAFEAPMMGLEKVIFRRGTKK